MNSGHEPPIRIVQHDPRHAGRVVAGAKVPIKGGFIGWNWSVNVDNVTLEQTRVCNACTHPCDLHTQVRRGCTKCACSIVEWTKVADDPGVVGEPASRPDLSGEDAPAVGEPGHLGAEGVSPVPPETLDAPPPRAGVEPSGPGEGGTHTPPSSGPLPNPITESRRRHLMARFSEAKLGDEQRHTIIAYVTGSRTTSSKEITDEEGDLVGNFVAQIRMERLSVEQVDGEWKVLVHGRDGESFLRRVDERFVPRARRAGGVAHAETGTERVAPMTDEERAGSF